MNEILTAIASHPWAFLGLAVAVCAIASSLRGESLL